MNRRRNIYTEREILRAPDLVWPERWSLSAHSLIHWVRVYPAGHRGTACNVVVLDSMDTRQADDAYVNCSACERGWWARMYSMQFDLWDIAEIAQKPYATIHQGLILAGAIKPGTTADPNGYV